MQRNIDKNKHLGYSDFFEVSRKKLGLEDFGVARVVAEYKGMYKVRTTDSEYMATITGKSSFQATAREDYPAVGDWVVLDKVDGGRAVIYQILSRKTKLERKYSGKDETQVIVTNIDIAFIVESIDRDYSLNRFERYCALVRESGIEPLVILNKIDRVSQLEQNEILQQIKNRLPQVRSIFTSVVTGEGVEELKNSLQKGKTYCFLGSSGVGKSSLINTLLGEETIKVGAIGDRSSRGTHTTTTREMYFLEDGGIVIDNPGTREVGLTDVQEGIDDQFDTIMVQARTCKFANCTHIHEPGCGVVRAVESGNLDQEAYQNYIALKKESNHYTMTKRERRNKDKQFGKFIKITKNDLKKYNYKNYV